mmetsp:Transcript_24196/g.27422  ORF Transcript_24196/g.27422 Transcript_24196/m.27422 type:complete len:84 (+) Transcript_24196:1674-1925(+)
MITKCGHYFCEDCAFDHNRTNKRCFICGRPTDGIFNVGTKAVEKLRRIEEQERFETQGEEAEEVEETSANDVLGQGDDSEDQQ